MNHRPVTPGSGRGTFDEHHPVLALLHDRMIAPLPVALFAKLLHQPGLRRVRDEESLAAFCSSGNQHPA